MWELPRELWEGDCGIVELRLDDACALAACADAAIFRYLSRVPPRWDASGMRTLLEEHLNSPNSKFYTIRRGGGAGSIRGMTAYLDVSEHNRRLEIGWTWLASAEHGSGLNRLVKRLMLTHAFDVLGALRVTLTCDSRNATSQKAIAGIGAQREGVMRQYGRMPDGFQRDVVVYSILKSEWIGARGDVARARDLSAERAEFERLDYDASFNQSYPGAYALFESNLRAVARSLRTPTRILDVGCGDGWTAATLAECCSGRYVGIDSSRSALAKVRSRFDATSALSIATMEGGEPATLRQELLPRWRQFLAGDPALIVCNAVGHELSRQGLDVDGMYADFATWLAPGGIAIVGDYWYPADVSASGIAECLDWIRRQTGHTPTAPRDLIPPERIVRVLRERSLDVADPQVVRSRPGLALHYYIIEARRH